MENLLVTTICRVDSNFFNEIAKLAAKNDCNIDYSHICTLGVNNIITAQIAGNWSGIAKMEATLPTLAKRVDIELICRRSIQSEEDGYFLPYRMDIVALNQPGIVHEITEFLVSSDIIIQHLAIESVLHKKTPLLKISLLVNISADNNIADIREQFLIFCDELNLDGTLEPEK